MLPLLATLARSHAVPLGPFPELFNSTEFWSAVIIALIGGGGIGSLLSSWSARKKADAEADNLAAYAAEKAVSILTDRVIAPLREQVEYQEQQIKHLERVQRKYFVTIAYLRKQAHWLNQFCEVVSSDWADAHPKPRLPDELREDIAPETLENQYNNQK